MAHGFVKVRILFAVRFRKEMGWYERSDYIARGGGFFGFGRGGEFWGVWFLDGSHSLKNAIEFV